MADGFIMGDTLALSRLLQLCSPALPVGAYAYSQAQESAIDAGYLNDADTTRAWISGVFHYSFATLDLPAMLLAYRYWQAKEESRVAELDRYLAASRESRELLLEDKEMGKALSRVLRSLKVAMPPTTEPSFATMFGCAGVAWQIDEVSLAGGFGFSWIENQVGIATKTVPLGQTDCQQAVAILSEEIAPAVERARLVADSAVNLPGIDWDFGSSLPAIGLLSARHEHLETRLYRS